MLFSAILNVAGQPKEEEVKKRVENILLQHRNGIFGSKLCDMYEDIYAEAAPGTSISSVSELPPHWENKEHGEFESSVFPDRENAGNLPKTI